MAMPGSWPAALERARAIPGVEDATLASDATGPGDGGCAATTAGETPRRTQWNTVDANYFDLMGVAVLRGATFSNAPGVIVNETMARSWWPDQDPIGKSLWTGCDAEERALAPVIGVARDTQDPLDVAPRAAYYLPRRETAPGHVFVLIARTAGDPGEWARPLVECDRRCVAEVQVFRVRSIEEELWQSFWETRWRAALLGGIGALAILLAAIGLYGVVACSVAQRTREIGVRMAVGAQPGDVQWMVLGEALRLTGVGVAMGLALSAATARLLRSFLYGLSPFDPMAFAGAALAWVLIAMLASWWPARRAAHVDPWTALKWDDHLVTPRRHHPRPTLLAKTRVVDSLDRHAALIVILRPRSSYQRSPIRFSSIVSRPFRGASRMRSPPVARSSASLLLPFSCWIESNIGDLPLQSEQVSVFPQVIALDMTHGYYVRLGRNICIRFSR